MNTVHLSRRSLLRRLGLGLGMLPLLESSRARAAGPIKRLVIVMQTGGCAPPDFFPAAGNLAGITLGQTLAPLEPHKRDIVVVDGIRMSNFLDQGNYGAGHENYASTFTGTSGFVLQRSDGNRLNGGGPTPDQVVAQELARTVSLPYRSLALAVQVDDTENLSFFRRCFWSGSNQAVTPEHDPKKIAIGMMAGRPIAGDNGDFDRLLKARASLLDYVGKDLEAFSLRVGRDDRSKIQQHLQSYQELQRRLAAMAAAPAPAAGSACKPPTTFAGNIHDLLQYKQTMNAHFDVVAAAFACDVTRVATVQLSNGSGTKVVFPDITDIGTTNTTFKDTASLGLRNYHDVQHNGGPMYRDKIKVDAWYMKQFAGLIERLKAIPDGGGRTVFDNTVILWGNHMGDGGSHSSDRLPWVLAGSCGGYFKTGQSLKPGRVHTNNLLVALCNAMGATRTSFGDEKYGSELAGLRA
jgi:hypothetical protein